MQTFPVIRIAHRRPSGRDHARRGSALITTVIFSGILGITVLGMLELSRFRMKTEYGRWHWAQAFYHAENALSWAGQKIADAGSTGDRAAFVGTYSAAGGSIHLDYMKAMMADGSTPFQDAWVTIEPDPGGLRNLYRVTTSAKSGDKVRTIQAIIRKNPRSLVFDYEYFLNNWGWWWGSTITGFGDNRANWDFDFRYTPTVNGAVRAAGQVESNKSAVNPFGGAPPFRGAAGADPISYVHSGVPQLEMPNLMDLTYYETAARERNGRLFQGARLVVDGVHTDSDRPGVYLEGTPDNPIRIDGPVVVPGDVVVKGTITGIGTLYVGGHLYIAGDLTYDSGPDFDTPPESMSTENRDQWVEDNVRTEKDLVGFAVRESILAGDVNSREWRSYCYDASWGLRHLGDEANLGADGVRHTPDDGVPYLDTDGDGQPDSAWFDADGDGAMDANYDHDRDLAMTSERAEAIAGYPVDENGDPVRYADVATNRMNSLDGIYYTNHAAAMRLAAPDTIWNGSLICRDEVVIYQSTLRFAYDSRIHSRYSDDPNRYIDLGLPVARRARIEFFDELEPVEGFYAEK